MRLISIAVICFYFVMAALSFANAAPPIQQQAIKAVR